MVERSIRFIRKTRLKDAADLDRSTALSIQDVHLRTIRTLPTDANRQFSVSIPCAHITPCSRWNFRFDASPKLIDTSGYLIPFAAEGQPYSPLVFSASVV